MNKLKIFLITFLISFSLVTGGCNMFPDNQNQNRPAPIRPTPRRTTPAPNMRNAPTKKVPGVSAVSEKQLMNKISAVENQVNKTNWDSANRLTNELGGDMARYRPDGANGKTLREMTKFNTIYAKLQGNVKTRNKQGCLKDTKELKKAVGNL